MYPNDYRVISTFNSINRLIHRTLHFWPPIMVMLTVWKYCRYGWTWMSCCQVICVNHFSLFKKLPTDLNFWQILDICEAYGGSTGLAAAIQEGHHKVAAFIGESIQGKHNSCSSLLEVLQTEPNCGTMLSYGQKDEIGLSPELNVMIPFDMDHPGAGALTIDGGFTDTFLKVRHLLNERKTFAAHRISSVFWGVN